MRHAIRSIVAVVAAAAAVALFVSLVTPPRNIVEATVQRDAAAALPSEQVVDGMVEEDPPQLSDGTTTPWRTSGAADAPQSDGWHNSTTHHRVRMPPSLLNQSNFNDTVAFLRQQCRRALPFLSDATWRNRNFIAAKYGGHQRFAFRNSVVCLNRHGRLFYDTGASDTNRQVPNPVIFFKDLPASGKEQFKASAGFYPAQAPQYGFREQLAKATQSGLFAFHASLAWLTSGPWGTVNAFHFTSDLLLNIISLLLSNPDLREAGVPRDVVAVHEDLFSTPRRWSGTLCDRCVQSASIATDRLHDPPLLVGPKGPVDGAMHCYCAAALIRSFTQGDRKRNRHLLDKDDHVATMTAFVRTRLAAKYELVPYGQPIHPDNYTSLRYWKDQDPKKPRLLFVFRKKNRFVANAGDMIFMARSMGFAVHEVAFENRPLREQFGGVRYADVLMGMHGAGLTLQLMLDTMTTPYCRTLIELLPFAPMMRVLHNHDMAPVWNVSAIAVPAINVRFGRSVARPAAEKKRLTSMSVNVHSLRGFNDQTASHDMNVVKHALTQAMSNWRRCKHD